MKVLCLDYEYASIFCEFCRIPCVKQIFACGMCRSVFHPWCTLHSKHKCVGCTDCFKHKCPVYDRLRRFSAKDQKIYQKTLLDAFFNIRNIVRDFDAVMKIMAIKFDVKVFLKQIEICSQNDLVFFKNILHKDNQETFCSLITDHKNLAIFNDTVFHTTKCSSCNLFFHSENPSIQLCKKCQFCHICTTRLDFHANHHHILFPHTFFEKGSDVPVETQKPFCLDCFEKYMLTMKYCPACLLRWEKTGMIECEKCQRWFHTNNMCSPYALDDLNFDVVLDFNCDICIRYEKYRSHEDLEKDWIDLKIPNCYFCEKHYGFSAAQLKEMLIISSKPYKIAHKLCAFGALKDFNPFLSLGLVSKKKKNLCMYCKKNNASIRCFFCPNKYMHYECALLSNKQVFVSNLPFPICSKHYKKVNLLSRLITFMSMLKNFTLEERLLYGEDSIEQNDIDSLSCITKVESKKFFQNRCGTSTSTHSNKPQKSDHPTNFAESHFLNKIKFNDSPISSYEVYDLEINHTECCANVTSHELRENCTKSPGFLSDAYENYEKAIHPKFIARKPSKSTHMDLKTSSSKHLSQKSQDFYDLCEERISEYFKTIKNQVKHKKVDLVVKNHYREPGYSLKLNSDSILKSMIQNYKILCEYIQDQFITEKVEVSKNYNSFMKDFQKEILQPVDYDGFLQIKNFLYRSCDQFSCHLLTTDLEIRTLQYDSMHIYIDGKSHTPNDIENEFLKDFHNLKLFQIFLTANSFIAQLFKKFTMYRYNPCLPLSAQANNYSLSHNYFVCQSNSDFYLSKSKIHGQGLFASRFYYPSELVIAYEGETLQRSECDIREQQYLNLGGDLYFFDIDGLAFVDSTIFGNFAKFINQSCDPNCFTSHMRIGSKNCVIIYTIRCIEADEEFTYKYGAKKNNSKCHCGAANCSKIL